ncbi:DUF7684 family protein [Devosia neptuniae]
MTYSPIILLHAPLHTSPKLANFVADCISSNVRLICVLGPDCERVHDVIDEIIVGDGSGAEGQDITTTWHTDETVAEVREFARQFAAGSRFPNAVQEITL